MTGDSQFFCEKMQHFNFLFFIGRHAGGDDGNQKRGFLVGEGNIAFPGISLKGEQSREQFCFRLGGNLRRNLFYVLEFDRIHCGQSGVVFPFAWVHNTSLMI